MFEERDQHKTLRITSLFFRSVIYTSICPNVRTHHSFQTFANSGCQYGTHRVTVIPLLCTAQTRGGIKRDVSVHFFLRLSFLVNSLGTIKDTDVQ